MSIRIQARVPPPGLARAGHRCNKHPSLTGATGVALTCHALAPVGPEAQTSSPQRPQQTLASSDTHKKLCNEQKDLVECIRVKTKRVRKLAKRVRKAKVEQKAQLQADMQSLVTEVNFDTDRLGELIKRMADAGYVDDCSSSSSDEEMREMEVLDAGMGGADKLVQMKRGIVNVCLGKACTRKGRSESIEQALQQHWEGKRVEVRTCSCMGMCKTAANVQIEFEGSTVAVTGLSPALLEERGVCAQELATVP